MKQPADWNSRNIKELLLDGMRAGARRVRTDLTFGAARAGSASASPSALADVREAADEVLALVDEQNANAGVVLGSFLQVAVFMGAALAREDVDSGESKAEADSQAWFQLQLLALAIMEALSRSNINASDAAEYRARTLAFMVEWKDIDGEGRSAT